MLEYLCHQRIDRTADDEVDMCIQAILVPIVLYVAINGRIDVEELLKLINDEGEFAGFSLLHQESEKFLERSDGWHKDVQFRRYFLAIAGTQGRFVFSAYKQVDEKFSFHCLDDKRRLSDTSATGHNRQS